jgi:hypothetical protein
VSVIGVPVVVAAALALIEALNGVTPDTGTRMGTPPAMTDRLPLGFPPDFGANETITVHMPLADSDAPQSFVSI